MPDLLQDYAEAALGMTDEQKEALIRKYLKQKEASKRRAKEQNEAKKKQGIKTVTIEVHGRYVKLFNQLVANSKKTRTDFFVELIEGYKPTTRQGATQGALFREPKTNRERQ